MLSALPLIPPQQELLGPQWRSQQRNDSPPPRTSARDGEQPHHRRNQNNAIKKPNPNSPHALLLADEATIQHRKAAIRNFGASWIRPPGIGKTLQAMREEEAEMAEHEEQARQQQNMRDMQARQEVEDARIQAGNAVEEEGAEERDLDDEIPDADADGEAEGDDVTFNDESIMAEGSHIMPSPQHGRDQEDYANMEEAELTGAARDEEELGIEHERDLDDSVPEAGSYQHTDTELEDSSSEEDDGSDLQDSFAVQSARRASRPRQQASSSTPAMSGAPSLPQTGLQERIRAQAIAVADHDEALTRSRGSLNLSSSLLESSFVGSSPVMTRGRGGGAGRGAGGRRGGGFSDRMS